MQRDRCDVAHAGKSALPTWHMACQARRTMSEGTGMRLQETVCIISGAAGGIVVLGDLPTKDVEHMAVSR